MKRVSETTLLRWRREVLNGTASHQTKVKLVAYAFDMVGTLGFMPSKLMDAYLRVMTDAAENAQLITEAATKMLGITVSEVVVNLPK